MNTDYSLYKGSWINAKSPHLNLKLSKGECKALLKQGGFLVRNTYDFDINEETSFWFIIKDTFGGMEELSSKTRNCIRRALKVLDIRIITKDLILKEGYDVYLSAFEKYKVKSETMDKESYVLMIQSIPDNYQFWGCLDRETNHLIAYSMNSIVDNTCHYLSMKSMPSYLRGYYPYYGLLYLMNQYYLEELKLLYVSDGARSITEHSNIQDFLIERFCFRKSYCHIQIIYKWGIKLIVNTLYPFRRIIPILKVKAVLNMESMQRKNNSLK